MGRMRYCERCGSPLTEDSKFCDNCGAAVPQEPGRDSDEQLFTPRRTAGNSASRAPRGRQAASEGLKNRESSRENAQIREREAGERRPAYGSSYEESVKTARPDKPLRRDNHRTEENRPYTGNYDSTSAGYPGSGASENGQVRRPAPEKQNYGANQDRQVRRRPTSGTDYSSAEGIQSRPRTSSAPSYGALQNGQNRRPSGDSSYGIPEGNQSRPRISKDPGYGAPQGSQNRRPSGDSNYGTPQGSQNRRPSGDPGYGAPQGGRAPRPPYRPQTGEPVEENYWQGQAAQKSRFRQEELESDWEESWERELSEEEEKRFTPVQWVLLGLMGVLVIALVTFGAFWAVGRTKKSSQDRQNGAVTEKRQEETLKNENGGDDVITILDENGQPMASTQTEPQTQAAPPAETQPQTQPQTQPETQKPTEKQTEQPAERQTETQPETQTIEILDGTQDQPAAASGEYILADSSSRLLTEGDVAGLSYDELQMAINEIYARHGRKFATPEIKAYFEGKSWYVGTVDADHFDETVFSDVENQNIQFLVGKMG